MSPLNYFQEGERGRYEMTHNGVLLELHDTTILPFLFDLCHIMGFGEAMQLEYKVLIEKQAWIEVDRTPKMKVLSSIWAFRCKRFLDGTVKKN